MDVGNTPHHTDIKPMTYETSFLETCDEQGNAPAWAIKHIFWEHGSDHVEFIDSLTRSNELNLCRDGKTILEWLGY